MVLQILMSFSLVDILFIEVMPLQCIKFFKWCSCQSWKKNQISDTLSGEGVNAVSLKLTEV